jgi:hypothetical protein
MKITLKALGLCVLALGACNSSDSDQGRKQHMPLPIVAIEDVPGPESAKTILERGSNIGEIAEKAYGHERFSGFVMRINGLSDPTRVPSGTEIETPSIPSAFRNHGASERYQPAINVLAKASYDFYEILPTYLDARTKSGVSGEGHFAISPLLRDRLTECADSIDAATHAMGEPQPGHAIPKKTIAQFEKASWWIRELSKGNIDGLGYDYDLVGQRLGLGFTNAIIWVQSDHQ